ncbi:hypothetical protein [Streptomyces chumphonensis]|uniref:hypothetical protein n=1 Tax=Streptomyces chumphonensis TaxID=1214925 RepID=UPI003D72C647
MTPVLPDVDALIRKALTAALPGAATVTLWPDDWYERLPLVVARVASGSLPDPRFLGSSIVDVQACARERSAASLLARQAVAGLFDACRAQFADEEAGGYLSYFDAAASQTPSELRTGSTAVMHTDTFRFQATCVVQARPLRAPAA